MIKAIKFITFFSIVFFYISISCDDNKNIKDLSAIMEQISLSVVSVSTNQLDHEEQNELMKKFLKEFGFYKSRRINKEKKPNSLILGSGFFIDENGYIITNNHVIDEFGSIDITLYKKPLDIYRAKIIGRDDKTDLALLKIDCDQKTPFVKFGNSDCVRLANRVYAIGNPLGYGGTITSGIVSYIGRYIDNKLLSDFIQIDAAINRGNSGGPIFNANGELIGVSTSIVSASSGGNIGIGFAIPSNVAYPIIQQLKNTGNVKRSWLGIKYQPISNYLSKKLELPNNTGVMIVNVVKNSPAHRGGMKVGDILYALNDQEILHCHTLPMVISELDTKKLHKFNIFRKKNKVDF